MSKPDNRITRRDFVADAGKAVLGAAITAHAPMIVPSHVLGGAGYRAPSDVVNFAVVGFGGRAPAMRRSSPGPKTCRRVRRRLGVRAKERWTSKCVRRGATRSIRRRSEAPAAIREGGEIHRFPRDAREGKGHRRGSSSQRRITITPSVAKAAMDWASTSTSRSRSPGRCTKRACCDRRRSRTRSS